MSRDKTIPPQPPTDETPWQFFERVTKQVVAVPEEKAINEKPRKRKLR